MQSKPFADQLPDLFVPKPVSKGFIAFAIRHPTMSFGALLLVLMLLMALFAPWLGTIDPTELAPVKRTREPSAEHWFGTDPVGRDIYSRVLYGARVSLLVGFSVAVLASLAGLIIGLLSGFLRKVDGVLIRVS